MRKHKPAIKDVYGSDEEISEADIVIVDNVVLKHRFGGIGTTLVYNCKDAIIYRPNKK